MLARARRHGISRAELAAANLRLRMAFRKDRFNRRIRTPGMTRAPEPLEEALGYRFRDRALLRQALVHPSSGVRPDNQRLEFLGDALLNASLSLLPVAGRSRVARGP